MTRLLVIALFLVGCSKFEAGKQTVDPSIFTAGDSSLNPATDKLVTECFGRPDFDGCLFLKNPVAQEQSSVTSSTVDQRRRFGIKLRGLNNSGYLENARLQVFALSAPRFRLANLPQLKTPGQIDFAVQLSAYYWGNRMFDYLGARVGPERLPLRGLKIYVDDVFTGYSQANRSVHLAKKEGEIPRAFSGEIVIHLAAQALADALSDNKLFEKNSSQHNFCVLDPKGCCTTDLGCAQALGSGFGDYVAAMMFPQSARAGETLSGSSDGQTICSLSRDLVSLAHKTRGQVFNACDPQGRAALMGAWYASVWWKLRAQVEAQEAGAGQDIDKIFFEHARAWTAGSTFTEARAAAVNASNSYRNGLYTASITAAFANVGIN